MSWDDALLRLFVKTILGTLCVIGVIVLYAFLDLRRAARRERRRLAELCRVAHIEIECPGPWLGRACEVCGRHPENVP